jgi:hypothetical protein
VEHVNYYKKYRDIYEKGKEEKVKRGNKILNEIRKEWEEKTKSKNA